MIIENDVSCIISTCQTKENGRAKCHRFWPECDPIEFPISQDLNKNKNVSVSLIGEVAES